MVNHKQIWIVRYIENKIGKTQALLLTFIFLIPWDTTFTTFDEVSSSMYAALFGITHFPSGNPYLVTKLVPLSLCCTFSPFATNITGPFSPAALPTRSTVIENLESLNFFHGGVYLCSQEPLARTHYKGSRFHPNSIESNDNND